jgi:single-strand DNA-binding protein
MNKTILLGRLTREPEVRYSQGANPTAIARFTLAVDRKFKKEGDQSADFINCLAFGKTAEFVEKYLKQGTKIALTGRIQTGSYTNKDNQKVYTTEVVADELEFAESKSSGTDNGQNSRPTPSQSTGDGFMNIPDGIDSEELPFN